MATVYIGNAVGNEKGTATGGEPGNQNGKELRIQAWYKNKKGWRVFRPISDEVAEKLVYDMTAACNNKNIGYSQGTRRNTLYTASKPHGFDCAKVDTPCDCDCSSLVRVCVSYTGIKINDFNTASEPTRLLATGAFIEMVGTEYTDSSKKLKAGDILCTKTKGHTAIVLNDGDDVDPPSPPVPPEPTDKTVVVVAKSVNVRNRDNTSGRVLFTAHNKAWYKAHGKTKDSDTFPLLGIAESGWYQIGEKEFITNLPKYTKLIEI